MTEEKLNGRELDLEIALRVLGWHEPVQWVSDEDGEDCFAFEPDADPAHIAADDQDHNCVVPRYHEDIALAWSLVEKLRAEGWWVSLSSNDFITEPWDCRMILKHGEITEQRAIAHGETAQIAICRVVLEAVAERR